MFKYYFQPYTDLESFNNTGYEGLCFSSPWNLTIKSLQGKMDNISTAENMGWTFTIAMIIETAGQTQQRIFNNPFYTILVIPCI